MACATPITVTPGDGNQYVVPCGKCPQCLKKRSSQWCFRLMQEEKIATNAYFITLTYDHLKCSRSKSGYLNLDKRHVQLFIKRLRINHERKNNLVVGYRNAIKYFAVGEYGGTTQRPHYHIILFNVELELIQPAWNMGQVHYGQVTGASVGYTMKYMSKPRKIPMHKNDDRQPEFSLMSKDLGCHTLQKT